jgi:DNA-directed RNA polymerase subunit H (RpoH/RPB5)
MRAVLGIGWSCLKKSSKVTKKTTVKTADKTAVKTVVLDVLAHSLVPEMAILSEAEKNKILKKYSITENQLPKMLHTDAAMKALNAAAGDVIKIKRDGETGPHLMYKLVV